MKPSRGVFKYGIYFFIGAWMFALGVIVGRGTSPVTFDTSSFQERLRVIVGEIPKDSADTEKVDLDFFKTLNKPVVQEPAAPPAPSGTASSRAEKPIAKIGEDEGPIPVKVSRKLATRDRDKAAAKPEPKAEEKQKGGVKKEGSDSAGNKAEAEKKVPSKGHYTIQVAAYRDFKDAVTQMSLLKEKGFTSYRTKGEAGGTTWYRVRTGAFKDYPSAQAELNRLKQAKINGMIIKKDDQ